MRKYFYFGVFILATVILPKFASADISISFSNEGNATATPGTAVTITGDLTNNATSSIVYLNSVSNLNIIPANTVATSSANLVAIDEATTKDFIPVMLNAGQKYSGSLVKVTVGALASAGDYLGMYTVNAGSSSATNEYAQTQYFVIHIPGTGVPAVVNTGVANGLSLQIPAGLQMTDGLQYQDNLNLTGVYINGPRLIKLEGTTTVYWVSANNLKIPMWTDAVFKSYKNNAEEVQVVAQEEFDFYQNAKYIRLIGNSRIYKTEGKYKRFIPSAVWNPAGIDPSLIIDVNKTDLNSYRTGKGLTSTEELN